MPALPEDADVYQQPVRERAETVEANEAFMSVWNSPNSHGNAGAAYVQGNRVATRSDLANGSDYGAGPVVRRRIASCESNPSGLAAFCANFWLWRRNQVEGPYAC
jgi:hypothetical protein